MDNNRTDIGKAINDKLNGHLHQPSEALWSRIEADLPKKKKRRIAAGWLFSGAAAVAVLLFISAGIFYFDANKPTITDKHIQLKDSTFTKGFGNLRSCNKGHNPGGNSNYKSLMVNRPISGEAKTKVAEPKTGKDMLIVAKTSVSSYKSVKNKVVKHSKSLTAKGLANRSSIKKHKGINPLAYGYGKHGVNYRKIVKTHRKFGAKKHSHIKHKKSKHSKTKANTPYRTLQSGDTEEILLAQDVQQQSQQQQYAIDTTLATVKPLKKERKNSKTGEVWKGPEDNGKKLYIAVYAGPQRFFYQNGKSLADQRLNQNNPTAAITIEYGLCLTYEVEEKWGLRLGLNVASSHRTTNDVSLLQTSPVNFTGVNYAYLVSNPTLITQLNTDKVTLKEKLKFIEIPLEASYRVNGEKLIYRYFAGPSFIYLEDNTVIAKSNTGTAEAGALKNIKELSLGASAGINLSYPLSNKFYVTAEPVAKSYFGTFKDANPVSLSFRVGLQYNFETHKKRETPKNTQK